MRYVESLNLALKDMFSKMDDVIIIGEDIIDPYGGAFKVTKGLSTAFPERVLTAPISEAAIVGTATGLAIRGFKVIVEIMFGDFLTLSFDQIVNHLTKYPFMYDGKVSAPLVIRTPMGGRRGYGPTHSQSLEKYFVGIPNLHVMMPSELHNPGESLKLSTELMQPVLFIEGKTLYPKRLIGRDDFLNTDWEYETFENPLGIGSTVFLSNSSGQSPDVTIISFGSTFDLIREATEELLIDDDVNVDIFMIENITSIDYSMFNESVRASQRVLLVEESTLKHGIGAELAAKIYDEYLAVMKRPIVRIGAENSIIPSARQLEDIILPSKERVIKAIRGLVS